MRLSGYPFVIVRVGCEQCKRSGQYRLARLADRFGAETTVDDLLDALTRDYAYRPDPTRRGRRKYEGSCKARLIDLEGAPRPPDVPVALVKLRLVENRRR